MGSNHLEIQAFTFFSFACVLRHTHTHTHTHQFANIPAPSVDDGVFYHLTAGSPWQGDALLDVSVNLTYTISSPEVTIKKGGMSCLAAPGKTCI